MARDGEIAELKKARAGLEERLAEADRNLGGAVASYRELVVRANTDVLEELVVGDSVATIDESLARAKVLVNRIREGMEAQIRLTRVPAGAPGRVSLDLSGLSPREKIQYAIKEESVRKS